MITTLNDGSNYPPGFDDRFLDDYFEPMIDSAEVLIAKRKIAAATFNLMDDAANLNMDEIEPMIITLADKLGYNIIDTDTFFNDVNYQGVTAEEIIPFLNIEKIGRAHV